MHPGYGQQPPDPDQGGQARGGQPLSAQPEYGQPPSGQSEYGLPFSSQPDYGAPVSGQPGYGHPVSGHPGYQQTGYEQQQQPPPYPYPGQQPGYGPMPYAMAVVPMSPPNSGLAVASMVVGIVSCGLALLGCCLWAFAGVPALLGGGAAVGMGWMSMKAIDDSHGQIGGKGMAIAGLSTGGVGAVIGLLWLVFTILYVVGIATIQPPS